MGRPGLSQEFSGYRSSLVGCLRSMSCVVGSVPAEGGGEVEEEVADLLVVYSLAGEVLDGGP